MTIYNSPVNVTENGDRSALQQTGDAYLDLERVVNQAESLTRFSRR